MSYYSENQKDNLRAIGERIQTLRIQKGSTQEEFAAYMDVPRSTVAKWENGAQDFKSEAIDRMATFFDCSIDYLIRGTSAENHDIYATTGLVDSAVKMLSRRKSVEDDFYDGTSDTIELINLLLSDFKFYSLLTEFNTLRADWNTVQTNLSEQAQIIKNAAPRSEVRRNAEETKKELVERAEFLLWKYEHSLDGYIRGWLESSAR